MHLFPKTIRFIFFLVVVNNSNLQAQVTKEVNDQFLKIMEAFVSGFSTIKGQQIVARFDSTWVRSKICITGAKDCSLKTNYETGAVEFTATLQNDDELSESDFAKTYAEWKKKIASLKFNSVPLIPYDSDKYNNSMYVKGYAWRLKTEGLSIDERYYNFTIRLEYMDLDQGGLLVKILITNN
jgi:hypothetical protein